MSYERKAYFVEHEYDDVNGFIILQSKNGMYQIAEKWFKEDDENADGVWMDYLIPKSDLQDRIDAGHCEHKAQVSDRQFEAVCEKVGWNEMSSAEQVEA
jgi:hypothetical protein